MASRQLASQNNLPDEPSYRSKSWLRMKTMIVKVMTLVLYKNSSSDLCDEHYRSYGIHLTAAIK